jgi:hypothetical protein
MGFINLHAKVLLFSGKAFAKRKNLFTNRKKVVFFVVESQKSKVERCLRALRRIVESQKSKVESIFLSTIYFAAYIAGV